MLAVIITEKPSLPFIPLVRKGYSLPIRKVRKLYFYEDELLAWIENGVGKTRANIRGDAGKYGKRWTVISPNHPWNFNDCDYGWHLLLIRHPLDEAVDLSMRLTGTWFSCQHIPVKIQRIISEVHECHNYPTDYIAAAILTAIAVGIGNIHLAQIKQGW